MKRAALYIIPVLLIAFAAVAEEIRVGSGQIVTVSASTATPTVWTNANVWVRSVTILGKKAERTDNTGDVYIGPISTNDKQAFKIAAGAEVLLEAAPGTLINLGEWYVDSTTAGDGVVLIYN